MGGVFSSKSKQKDRAPSVSSQEPTNSKRAQARAQVTSKDKAILELKNARDRLKKYQTRLDIEAQQLQDSAKQLLQADKRDRAKLALKVKKFKEQQIKQADSHLLTVLEMLDTVEWESQQLKVFEGLKAGNSVLDAIHKEMSVEAVQNLMLETEEAQETERPGEFWLYLSICVALITTAGLMAGLTMGLLSLDMLNMRILQMEGSADEKRWASRVLPILSKHHFLLVTLMLVNAGANEALPIFLSRLVPESVSIILSVTCVLLFGEILPSAVFTGPSQLRIAATLTPIVRVLMAVVSPIAYPIAKLLDWFLGDDHDVVKYKRKELKALVALQRETDALRRHNAAFGTRLHVDEVTIIHGALDLSAKTVQQVMIPIEKVYMLEFDTKLDDNMMAEILASGHSRIPIYRKHRSNIVGLLLVKRLIVVDPEDERPIGDLVLRKPIVVTPDESCYHILNEFQKGRSHIALVTPHAKQVMQCWCKNEDIPVNVAFVGIVTIEDVIEELIQEEIEDESDIQDWKARATPFGTGPSLFSYFHYLLNRHKVKSPTLEDVWAEYLDVNRNGILDENEVLTVASLAHGDFPPDSYVEEVRSCLRPPKKEKVMEKSTAQGTVLVTETLSPHITIEHLRACQEITSKVLTHVRREKQFELMPEDEVTFHMLSDQYRQILHELFLSIWPKRSQFELPYHLKNRYDHIDDYDAARERREQFGYIAGGITLLLVAIFWSDLRRIFGFQDIARARAESASQLSAELLRQEEEEDERAT
ncbi:hypothetical protein P43SY_004957 [Pythium insidiosum]|uniref:Uncharacterized protein n=1 Tax=Pythium insidiosum TaxID=114742 RepID=A0AAD5LI12_PYTIN|nr:hypothetical protein P43SY_004957 [Pythium insidiosum]